MKHEDQVRGGFLGIITRQDLIWRADLSLLGYVVKSVSCIYVIVKSASTKLSLVVIILSLVLVKSGFVIVKSGSYVKSGQWK